MLDERVSFRPTADVAAAAQALFEAQKARIEALLPDADVQHIGGTAVAGALTKGDLDINVRVEPARFDEAVSALRTLYAVNQPENWTADFASFKDNDAFELPLGVQLCAIGTDADDFVLLRDLLNARPELVELVNALKSRFEGGSMAAYREAKAVLYEQIRNEGAR